jgi:hypothetical protein
MNPHEYASGSIISIMNKAATLAPISFGNYQARWNAASDRIEIATIAGTEIIDYSSAINYGIQSTTINGAGGVDASLQATRMSVTTTFAAIGDVGLVGIEHRRIHIWDALNHYIINVTRKGTTATDGFCDLFVEKIGVSVNKILSAGNGLALQNDTLFNPNKISKVSPIASAQNGTLIRMGEFDFRYSLNATNGNLEIKSATTLPVNCRYTAQEFFSAGTSTLGNSTTNTIINGSAGAFVALNGGGAGNGEMCIYRIITAMNKYNVCIENFADTQIHICVEKNI